MEVHDYPSATVLPGLIDTHVHLVADSEVGALDRVPELGADALNVIITASLRRHLASGVTTVRDLGDIHYAVVARRDEQHGRTQQAEPTIVASGPPITSVADTAISSAARLGTRLRSRQRYRSGRIAAWTSSR